MKKSGLCRVLCFLLVLMLALGAVGAGKPVAARLLSEDVEPSAPDRDETAEPEATPEENASEQPESSPNEDAPVDAESPENADDPVEETDGEDPDAELPESADDPVEEMDAEPTPAFDFTALQTFGAGQIDGMLLTGNAAVPTVEGYADVVLADVLRVDCDDAESFRRNPALIGKAARITMPEGLSLTLIFTVTEPVKQMSVFRLGENGTVRLDAERSGDELRVPLTESGVYFVMNTNKLLTLLGVTGGSLQHAGSNRILLDDFHYVTLNAPLNESSDTDTDGDGVPDCEEVGEAHAIDLGDGIEITAYAFRSDPTLPDTDFDGIPDTYDNAPTNNVFTGKMKSGHDGTTSVSFTVDYRNFFGDNTTYQPTLATYSVMGAALAYMDKTSAYDNAYLTLDAEQTWSGGTVSTSKKLNGRELMELFGFQDVQDFKLSSEYSDDDLCEALVGWQTVTYNGETKVLLAIWVRGTDSKSLEEWSSNFHMGDLVRFFDEYDSVAGKSPRQKNDDWTRKSNHRGFDVCATRILKFVEDYYTTTVKPVLDENPSYSLAYWITGHSRGAAVGNLIASYLIDLKNELYAYTFATPYNTANTEASAEKYDCIFNLVNSNDFVPMLPMPEWGFTRYGKTAEVDASQWAAEIKTATGETYSGKYLAASDKNTLLGKFICITGENADRNNPGKLLGWREVYVYHCGHTHEGETVGNYQSTTCREKHWDGPSESSYNGYAEHLRKYSYWHDGICETPAYCLQVLVELLVQVAQGNTLGGGWNYLTGNKLADKFDFDKQSLVSYATKLTEPHYMDTYSVIQAQINAAGNPGARFLTLPYYTQNSNGSRPPHTHTYIYVAYEGQKPTCTEEGFGYRYCLCSEANEDYYDDYQKNVRIPATGHDWEFAGFTWTGDDANGYTAVANYVCKNDATHTATADAVVTVETTEPTAASEGQTTYTATVSADLSPDGFLHTDTKTVTLPVLKPQFKTISITMSGEIGLNFFVVFPEGIDCEHSRMTFSIGTNGSTSEDAFDASDYKLNADGTKRYRFTCYLNALQMADTVTATLHYTVSGETAERTLQKDYSVQRYVAYFEPYFNDSSSGPYDEATLNMVKSVADYGYHAQPFLFSFHHIPDGTYARMSGYTESYDLETIRTAVQEYGIIKSIDNTDIDFVTFTLSMESETAIVLRLTMKNNDTVPYITVNGTRLNPGDPGVSYGGQVYVLNAYQNNEEGKHRYEIRIKNIPAHKLADEFTVSGDANGAFEIKSYALYYTKYILSTDSSNPYLNDTNAQNCVAALYCYYKSVKEYIEAGH